MTTKRAAKAGPAWWVIILAATVARVGVAGTDPPGTVEARPPAASSGGGGCPEPKAVQSALRNLGARDDPERLVAAAAGAKLEVEDLGREMRVSIGGRRRAYGDPGRDCERRARLAALFAALVLTPGSSDRSTGEATNDAATAGPDAPAPAQTLPSPTPPLPPMAIAALPPPKAQSRATTFALGAGPVLAIAPHRGSALVSPGVFVGAFLGPGRGFAAWQLAAIVAVPVVPASFALGGTAVSAARYPLRLSAGRIMDLGAMRATAELGAVVSVLRLERTGPPPTATATRVEAGVHLGGEVAFPFGRWSVFLEATSEWIPRTYPLRLEPAGEVDRTPALWISGQAGLRFVLH